MFFEEIIGAFTGQNRRTRHKHVAIGTTLGILAGAAVALLFAPQSGKETREDIANATIKGKDKAFDIAEKGYSKAKEYLAQAGESLGSFTDSLGDTLKTTTSKIGREGRKLAREERRKLRKFGEKLTEGEDCCCCESDEASSDEKESAEACTLGSEE